MICHYKTNLSGAFRVYYYINERIARYEHQRTILEIFPHRHHTIYGNHHLPSDHSFFGRIAGSTHYLYFGTHTNDAPDGKVETETQCCRIADYGRDGYGIFGSARTDNLATGKPTSGHQSGPANIHCPDAAGGRVYQRKNGL